MNKDGLHKIARHVVVQGRVQGVSYRAAARNEARRQGVAGWVRNQDDGRVEAWLEGDHDAVRALLSWMGRGPARARVTDLQIHEGSLQAYDDFEIR